MLRPRQTPILERQWVLSSCNGVERRHGVRAECELINVGADFDQGLTELLVWSADGDGQDAGAGEPRSLLPPREAPTLGHWGGAVWGLSTGVSGIGGPDNREIDLQVDRSGCLSADGDGQDAGAGRQHGPTFHPTTPNPQPPPPNTQHPTPNTQHPAPNTQTPNPNPQPP